MPRTVRVARGDNGWDIEGKSLVLTRAEPAGFAGSEASREGMGTLPGFP